MTVPGERTEVQLALIEALKGLPVRLEQETGGLSDAVLRYRPAELEYSIKETSGHLRDLAEVWHKRLNAICGLTDPRWSAFDGDASVRSHGYQEADLQALIGTIREWRTRTADLLAHAVDWTRLGQHPELGRRSLRQWAEFMVAHDEEHLAAIRSLKEAQTAARLP
jgi:hypothetical protein